ncbi:MAG TPA: universal stress protein [Myxococcales bacterium]|nr:universal stress protein [Myxococcales bacterium]
MKRILAGYDGSNESRVAVGFAADLAQALNCQLTIATSVYFQEAFGAPELQLKVAQWEAQEKVRCAGALKEAAAGAARPGVRVETAVLSGPPAEALAEQAKIGDVDLVVVGHRGRGAISRFLTGSVADRLVQICSKPVTVVR